MPTHALLNGLSGNLQSSESWAHQQALGLIRETLARTLASLTPDQQRDYVRLQREALKTFKAVEDENAALLRAFKQQGLAQLRARLGGKDPEQIFLRTRYLEKLEPPLPWEPRTSTFRRPSRQARFRRAVDEWKYRTHESSLSLWEAACLNFDFATGTSQRSGHSFINASYLTDHRDASLTVESFVTIARELDLGGQLQTTLTSTLGVDGKLHGLIQQSSRASLLFEALEAYRNRADTGLTVQMYDSLVQAIDGRGPALKFDTLSMSAETEVPLPLLVIHVASLGVVSYFPFRPGGALRYHADAESAARHFAQQLKASHTKGDLGWFARQLPSTEMHAFKRLLKDSPRPVGLTPAAAFLYDTFHKGFPARSLDTLRFSTDPKQSREKTVAQALTLRQVQRYQANLATLATRRSERDLQGVIDGAAAMAGEILELLLTPMPGGVTGLNRIMQTVVFGNLAYSLITGLDRAAKGEVDDFAAALADVADLAINGLLITTAGRVHRQRLTTLLQSLGNPRKVTLGDGTRQLWKPDISPYAIYDQNLLNGQLANAQGVYPVNGHRYVWLRQGEQQRVVEVSHDAVTMRFMLKHQNGARFAPPIVFDPSQQAWRLDLHDARGLSDIQLAERMLPNGSTAVPASAMQTLLRSTSPTRATLDAIWAGQPAPINLIEGVRRLQVDRVIDQLISDFHRRGTMPPHADGTVLCLLTQLPSWPDGAAIQVHDSQGALLETYARTDTASHFVQLKRRDDGVYRALDDTGATAASQEQLFELILNRQPAGSTLGMEGSPHLTQAQRIARLRVQISQLARAERLTLFSAMTRYAGYTRQDLSSAEVARRFLPVKVAAPLVVVTPLLQKLHATFPPLTPANLVQLLERTPLSGAQQARFLQDASLPQAVRENLEHYRTALRIDAVIDGLYHPRAFNQDTDLWAREFAASLVRTQLDRHFVISEVADGNTADRYVPSGPEDTTVELLHYGEGRYEAYDMRNAGPIPVSSAVDSFYLAIGSVLQPHERKKLGMQTDTDAQGLRTTLGDLMSAQRSPEGSVSLLDQSLGQYEQRRVLPTDLQPDAQGIYHWNDQQLMALYGSLYPITFDTNRRKWRLKHPQKVGVDTPRLEHNGHGAWRLASENPMTWDDHRLFYRLGPGDYHVDQATAARILNVTDTPARALREVHSAGLQPPPLLEDTSKRFRIEREINYFIKAMTTYSASRNARPSLQLQVACALPGWPDSHVLEVLDEQKRLIYRRPAHLSGATEKIQLSQAQSRSSEPLNNLVRNDTLTRALLGELPASEEERLFKLAKKIAEYAYQERSQLFESLYEQSESGATALQQRLKAHFTALPLSAIKALLHHATPNEIEQIQQRDQVSLRLTEQARLSADDLRLNRAFEGLYLNAPANQDSEKIILHLLKSVPGWPSDLRVDIYQGNAAGALLQSTGHLAGSVRKTLARRDGRYQAYGADGTLIDDQAAPTDLLNALSQLLTDSQCQALGILDSNDLSPLRNSLADLALNQRIAIKSLLDLPHIPHWLQPPTPVHSSFIAYPFSLRNLWPFGGNPPVDLVSKARELYPSFSVAAARELIDSLGLSEPAALIELERRKAEYQALDFGLTRWAQAPHANDIDDPLGMNLGRRRYIAQQIRQAWRRETRIAYIDGLFDAHHLSLQLDGNDLPDADFILGTRGFEHIEYLNISGSAFPANGNDFLGKFSSLLALKLDCMLDTLPTGVTDMTQLSLLDVSDNNIVLTEESRQRLAGMTHLEELFMDGNPLGLTPDISAMRRLRNVALRATGIDQWPIGAERRTNLRSLLLQENRITTLPEELFTNNAMHATNRNTVLHDNPLSEDTRRRLEEYRLRVGSLLGGAMPGTFHVQQAPGDVNQWLIGVADAEKPRLRTLWQQLEDNQGASADDTFRVLRDLTNSHPYIKNSTSRQALAARVWRLLEAMGKSTELREHVFLNTYVAGTCGDGALLVFIDMEIAHLRHQARAKPSSDLANRELLSLSRGLFYLRALDQLADKHLQSLYEAGMQPDDAEVKLHYRIKLAKEFNLPVHDEAMLYPTIAGLTEEDFDNARTHLRSLSTSDAVQNALLTEEFWIEYLARNVPEPFTTIKEAARYKVDALNREIPDKRSEVYLERRQSLIDLEIAERNRLVSQLTQAAQLGAQRLA